MDCVGGGPHSTERNIIQSHLTQPEGRRIEYVSTMLSDLKQRAFVQEQRYREASEALPPEP